VVFDSRYSTRVTLARDRIHVSSLCEKRFINSSVRSRRKREREILLFVLFNPPDSDIKSNVHSRLERGHEGLIGRRTQRNSIASVTNNDHNRECYLSADQNRNR